MISLCQGRDQLVTVQTLQYCLTQEVCGLWEPQNSAVPALPWEPEASQKVRLQWANRRRMVREALSCSTSDGPVSSF